MDTPPFGDRVPQLLPWFTGMSNNGQKMPERFFSCQKTARQIKVEIALPKPDHAIGSFI
jgi:hypothetical protein